MVKIKQETFLAELKSSTIVNNINNNNNKNNNDSNNKSNDVENLQTDDIYRLILQPGRCTKRLLSLSDSLLTLFLITPMVVTHWNSVWALIDYYPQHFTPLNSFLFGCMLHTCFVLIKDLLHKAFSTPSTNGDNKLLTKRFRRFVAMKCYTYIFSWGCNMHWRGGWAILDRVFGAEILSASSQIIICSVLLTFLKSLRNLSAPPTFVLIDSKYMACSFPTRFRVKGSRDPGLYVLDCIFSVLIVGTLVVVAWRGVWVMFDLILYPQNKAFSAWGSLTIGYGIVAITFGLQPIMRWTCDRLTGFWRIAAADIFLFLSFIGTVNVWRGVWMLLDVYLLPENHILSCWITHAVSFFVLALLNCSNSLLVRGVYIDAEEPAGECVVFPIHYIRLFFQKERTKKQKRLIEAMEKHQDQENLLHPDKQTLINHNNIKIITSNSNSTNINNNNNNNNINSNSKNISNNRKIKDSINADNDINKPILSSTSQSSSSSSSSSSSASSSSSSKPLSNAVITTTAPSIAVLGGQTTTSTTINEKPKANENSHQDSNE